MDFSNLQSRVSSAAFIPPHTTQLHPRMHSFSSFSSPNPKSAFSSPQSREKLWIFAAALLVIPFLFYICSVTRGVHSSSKFSDSKPKGFGIIIDASRSGSRVRVFEFRSEGRIPFVGFDGNGLDSMKVRPGIFEFEADPENAGSSILSLLDFAKERVPKAEWKDTEVWLMATRGPGKLGLDVQKRIMESCRRVLRSSGFLFKDEWASVISGQDEGLYAWVAANYAFGTLGGDPLETTGIIELGGASAQVTFTTIEPPAMEFSRVIKLAGATYNLYSRSMLHYGQDTAWDLLHELSNSKALTSSSSSSEKIVKNPCIPRGYTKTLNPTIAFNANDKKFPVSNSVGNFSACRSEARELLQKRPERNKYSITIQTLAGTGPQLKEIRIRQSYKFSTSITSIGSDMCLHPPCSIVSSFMPELRGKPVAAQNFFFTSEFFGLLPRASLSELEAAGQHYCEDDWAKLKDEHLGVNEEDLLRYCFSSAYIVALLHDGLGIPMYAKRIGFANQAGSFPLDWTLGAFILQMAVKPELEQGNLDHIVGNDFVTYLTLFALLFLAILAAFYVSKLRKPQLKTVYDLEKGHYIVTRIPR